MENRERDHLTARQCFIHDCQGSKDPDMRMNCGACVLRGYEPRGGWGDGFSVKRDGPYYSGWARVYVEARMPIPEKWKDAFERERNSDNKLYAAALEEAIKYFGITFV